VKRTTGLYILAALATTLSLGLPVYAEKATQDEALEVARGWIDLVVATRGGWGKYPTAEITEIQEFKRGNRVLGYFCPVKPVGYVVISLYKELASVKAYSETDDIDPNLDEGMTDLLKGGLERMMDTYEKYINKDNNAMSIQSIDQILEIDYTGTWDKIKNRDFKIKVNKQTVSSTETADAADEPDAANYSQGRALLTSRWHQGDPYNRQCPAGSSCTHCVVGCVATAGAQIMRYWNWPPYGSGSPYDDAYDWRNMLDSVSGSSPAESIDAVAELCHEVGVAVDMEYGCDSSSAATSDMEGVYENHYRYSSSCSRKYRILYTASDWFNRIKSQLNVNRPIQYRIPNHSIVCDGWQEVGDPIVKQYHMNYGWGGNSNAWYTLDALKNGSPNDEYMLESIVPTVALGGTLSGTYTLASFPYRYFDRDATCSTWATFNSGQYLQFLPNVVAKGTSTTEYLRIYGSSSDNTHLFTRGDTSQGVLISDGCIRIMNGGGIVLR